MGKFAEIEKLKKDKITPQMNFLKGEITQLLDSDYSDTIQNAKYKDEKLFRLRKRVRRLNYLYEQLTKELK